MVAESTLTAIMGRMSAYTGQAVTWQQALDSQQNLMPQNLAMDMSLPVLSGWEATQQLKANPGTRAIPVIALTAHAMANDEQRARESGCDDFDTKPIELPRLLGKIEALLQRGAAT